MYVQARITTDFGRSERRREDRHDVEAADMELHKLGIGTIDARLINISSRGFMAEAEVAVEKGSRIWLTIPGVPRLNARINWSINGRFGGEFANPIDPLMVLVAIGKGSAKA